jgi:hypothetical protein
MLEASDHLKKCELAFQLLTNIWLYIHTLGPVIVISLPYQYKIIGAKSIQDIQVWQSSIASH